MRTPEVTLRRAIVCLTIALALFAWLGVKSWHGPLLGPEDVSTWEYFAWFVEKNVHLTWLGARITLVTDGVFYPYGTVAAFQPYAFEVDLFYAAMHAQFGEGPWFAIHYLVAFAVGAIGLLLVLAPDLGARRATFASFVATFMNFYALLKWPCHPNIAVLHWMLLGMAVDFVLFRRLARGERVTSPWLLFRGALVLELFGLDLGYVAGFGLTSFVVTFLFSAGLVWRRRTWNLVRPAWGDVRAAPWFSSLALLLTLVPLYFYLPLTLEVFFATRRLPFDGPGGNLWASQARLLFPYLPFTHPQSPLIATIFGSAEGIGELQVGWFLLGLAVLGAVDARRARGFLPFAPLLVTFALAFAYNPAHVPTLRIFPWFAFDRVSGRATVFFPLVCGLLATAIDVRRRTRALRVLLPIGGVELVTGWWLVARAPPPATPAPDFGSYMATIRAADGEAIFDWPFCIAGGDGTATSELCPFYGRNANVYAYRRFHEKKVIGQYMSRLHPSQVKPYFDAGWAGLFAPDDPDPRRARAQVRCFDEREWAFVDDMLVAGDFAGISLYPELLPDACVDEFHARFGPPAATTTLDGVGRAEFLRLSRARRSRTVATGARETRLTK